MNFRYYTTSTLTIKDKMLNISSNSGVECSAVAPGREKRGRPLPTWQQPLTHRGRGVASLHIGGTADFWKR